MSGTTIRQVKQTGGSRYVPLTTTTLNRAGLKVGDHVHQLAVGGGFILLQRAEHMEDENGGASLEANFGTRVAEIQQRLRQKCGGIDMQGGQCCHSCQDVTTVTVFPALRLCLRCEYEMLGSVVIREIWRESNVKKKDDRLVITPGGKS